MLIKFSFLNILFFLVFSQVFIFGQMEEEEGDSITYFRERWFYGQREFPVDSIPRNAYSSAIIDKENIYSAHGNLLDVPFRWNNIGPKPILNGWDGHNSGRGAFIQFDNNFSRRCWCLAKRHQQQNNMVVGENTNDGV
jgi:hypothetical protein